MICSFPVCQTTEEIHPGPRDQGSEGVDESDEEDDPDGRVPGRALRAVEASQRNRRRTSKHIPINTNNTQIILNNYILNLKGNAHILIHA